MLECIIYASLLLFTYKILKKCVAGIKVNIGRQLVELLCFSGDLPLTDIFLIMCIYWLIN